MVAANAAYLSPPHATSLPAASTSMRYVPRKRTKGVEPYRRISLRTSLSSSSSAIPFCMMASEMANSGQRASRGACP